MRTRVSAFDFNTSNSEEPHVTRFQLREENNINVYPEKTDGESFKNVIFFE